MSWYVQNAENSIWSIQGLSRSGWLLSFLCLESPSSEPLLGLFLYREYPSDHFLKDMQFAVLAQHPVLGGPALPPSQSDTTVSVWLGGAGWPYPPATRIGVFLRPDQLEVFCALATVIRLGMGV